jgi:hypothetical protein
MTWKVPGYVVDELLGFGGSGEVWRGHVSATGDPVALKRLPVDEPAQVQAARAEAALLSTLDHPHLIRLHELVPLTDAVVLVLDLAAGGSLADLLTRRGRLTPGEVITALAPIGAALAYAHNEGVVHGDVSPANILFTEPGLPLLADLGVARIVGDCGPVRSTPGYIDPAVAAGCAPGAPSDVFMLAAVAVHALTGAPVWTGATVSDALAQAACGELEIGKRLVGVPPDLAAVLERALAVEPHLRCNAAEFALDLRHSGEPTSVELSAGLSRPDPAAALVAAVPAEAQPAQLGPLARDQDDLARPAFSRPGLPAAGHHAALTHGVRAALPPRRPTRRAGLRDLLCHRITRYASLVVLVLGLVAWTGFAWFADHGEAASAPSRASLPSPSPPSAQVPPTVDAQQAASVLRGLDEVRGLAFAHRDPSLLARVYVSGPLLAQDVALIERTVPEGCGLLGVRTAYSSVRVVGSRDGLVVTARATLAPSTLRCAGTKSGTATGQGPSTLRVALARRGGGFRIVSQQVMP